MPRAHIDLTPLFQAFTKNPLEETDPSTGLPVQPSWWRRQVYPEQSAAIDAVNLKYGVAPIFAKQATYLYQENQPKIGAVDRSERGLDANAEAINHKKQWMEYHWNVDPNLRATYNNNPDLAYSEIGQHTEINPTIINPVIEARTFGAASGPENAGNLRASIGNEAFKQFGLSQTLGTPSALTMNADAAARAEGRKLATDEMFFPKQFFNTSLAYDVNRSGMQNELVRNQGVAATLPITNETDFNTALLNRDVSKELYRESPVNLSTMNLNSVLNNIIAQLGGTEAIPKGMEYQVNPEGSVEKRYANTPEGMAARLIMNEYKKFQGTKVAKDSSGKVIPAPPPEPVSIRQVVGLPNMQPQGVPGLQTTPRLQTTPAPLKIVPPSPLLAPSKPLTPWDSIFQSVASIANNKDISPQQSHMANLMMKKAFIEELVNFIKLPEQFIGSSNVHRSKISILEDLLKNPATAQQIEEQVNKLPPETLVSIKNRVAKRVKMASQ